MEEEDDDQQRSNARMSYADRMSAVGARMSYIVPFTDTARARRAPGASCWACVVFGVGIMAILAAYGFGEAYKGVDKTAKCVLHRLENITGIDTNEDPSGELLGVPLSLLNLVDSDFGAFEVFAVLPAVTAACLYTVAVLIIWCPNVPNPTCSKCIVGFANVIAFLTIMFYMAFVGFRGALDLPWVTRQLDAYDMACAIYDNETWPAPPVNSSNSSIRVEPCRVDCWANWTNSTPAPPSMPPPSMPPFAPPSTPPSMPPPGLPVFLWDPNRTSGYLSPREALRRDPEACECLLRFAPELAGLWKPGTFAIIAVILCAIAGTTLRCSTPTAKQQAKKDLYGDYDVLYYQICAGDGGWLNLICFPLVLVYHGTKIYACGCVSVLASRLYRFFAYPFLCCCGWIYHDETFTGEAALGGKSVEDLEDVEWIRAVELRRRAHKKAKEDRNSAEESPLGCGGTGCCAPNEGCKRPCISCLKLFFCKRPGGMQLYEGGIEPADLCQGAIGDCWLVAALASAAEQPASIRNAFITPEYNPRGRYDVRLFDPSKKEFVTVTVDDTIPVKKGSAEPLYMKMNGDELWAVILEKAFAKFCGSYGALDGGWAVWGWRVLTGDHCFRLTLDEGRWHKTTFEASRGENGIDGMFRATDEAFTPEETWHLILNYIEAKGLVGASGGAQMGSGDNEANGGGLNGEQLNEDVGLVGTHAYSILDAKELGLIPGVSVLGSTKLVQLRNPWGSYEWKGAWSDGSKEWDENPLVKARLRPKDKNDGTFWMPFDELISGSAGFVKLDFCDRTTKKDLNLKLKEDLGMFGIIFGCLKGLCRFMFCRGMWVIYCGSSSSGSTRSTKRGCDACIGCGDDVVEPKAVEIDIAHRAHSRMSANL